MCYREVQPTDYMSVDEIVEHIQPGYVPEIKAVPNDFGMGEQDVDFHGSWN